MANLSRVFWITDAKLSPVPSHPDRNYGELGLAVPSAAAKQLPALSQPAWRASVAIESSNN